MVNGLRNRKDQEIRPQMARNTIEKRMLNKAKEAGSLVLEAIEKIIGECVFSQNY